MENPKLIKKDNLKRKPRTQNLGITIIKKGDDKKGEIKKGDDKTGTNYKKGDEHTIPKDTYEYIEVPWEAFLVNVYTGYKSVRSSFIPYTFVNNEIYWLLGSFQDYPRDILADFGGSCVLFYPPREHIKEGERQFINYQHQFGCAMLELNEESKGLLVQPVLRSLGVMKPKVYRGTNERMKEYVWFVMVYIPYNEIKDIPEKFEKSPNVMNTTEIFGPMDFYKIKDILNKQYRTSRNLTDFINYLNKK